MRQPFTREKRASPLEWGASALRRVSDGIASFGLFGSRVATIVDPVRIPRAEHSISRSQISSATLKVLYTLKDAGYEAYMVGGGVRDLLAGVPPKDFDVATDARPEQIRALFRSCRLVGRRFLIAHVRFGSEILEVTTFRGPISDSHERDDSGRILSDNVYGTLEEDAFRRDFTVNGLYYDIRDFSIVDYVGGLEDLKRRQLRLIGDPELRYREDPVRMLRAVRIASKLGFEIEASAREAIPRLAPLLGEVPAARLFEEVLKILLAIDAAASFRSLRELGLFREMFPQSEAVLAESPQLLEFVESALSNTADRLARGATVSPSFLYAALLWPAVERRATTLQEKQGQPPAVAWSQAAEEVVARQISTVAIPKRFSVPAREIWMLQPRFEQRRGARAKRLLGHPRFRAAYDFLLLRAEAGLAPQELAQWWTDTQESVELKEFPPVPDEDGDAAAVPRKRRRRRRSRIGKPAG